MKPQKHPLLFSVLALTLACLLFNASVIQVSGIPVWVIILGLIGAGIGGGIVGWFAHDALAKQSETPGVNLDSYVKTVTDSWANNIKNMANYLRSITESLTWSKEYYSRVASYKAGEFLDKESLDDPVMEYHLMKDIARDLYYYYANTTILGLKNFGNQLKTFSKDRLTGDLETYSIWLGHSVGGVPDRRLKDASSDVIPIYKYGGSFKAWIFGEVLVSTSDTDTDNDPDGEGTWIFKDLVANTTVTITVHPDKWYSVMLGGIYEVSYQGNSVYDHGYIAMQNILIISDTSNIQPAFAALIAGCVRDGDMFEVYGFENLENPQVIYLDEVWAAVRNIINHLDLIYDTAFNSAKMVHENCRNAGYTDPSQADKCPFLHAPPTISFPTTEEMYETFGTNYDEMLAYYLALMQKLNETMAQLEDDFTGMLSELNLTFADVREHFENVILKIGNETLEIKKLIPLWITQAQEFFANASNTLQGLMGALAIFKNGTVKYITIPPGSILTPQMIMTPNGLVPSLVLTNYEAGLNPAYTPGNYTKPTFVTPADETVQVTLQLLFAILPLMLLLAVVNMITAMGRRR